MVRECYVCVVCVCAAVLLMPLACVMRSLSHAHSHICTHTGHGHPSPSHALETPLLPSQPTHTAPDHAPAQDEVTQASIGSSSSQAHSSSSNLRGLHSTHARSRFEGAGEQCGLLEVEANEDSLRTYDDDDDEGVKEEALPAADVPLSVALLQPAFAALFFQVCEHLLAIIVCSACRSVALPLTPSCLHTYLIRVLGTSLARLIYLSLHLHIACSS